MSVTVDISNEFDPWPAGITDIAAFTARAIDAALAGAKVALQDHVEVSIVYCDDAFIHDLNKQWRHKDSATNVLSFPLASGAALAATPMLGDIIISCETVIREARDEGKTFADHLTHMLVHGALHLAGYDHEIDAEAETMEALERVVLSQLGVDDPYKE